MAGKSKGAKEHFAVYEPGVDLRLDFIFEFVTRSFKIKLDKWLRLLTTEIYKKTLHAFLEDPSCMHINFTLSTSGILKASDVYGTALKTKSCFFIKKHPIVMSRCDYEFKENLVYGELPPQMLQHLVLSTEEVVQPMIKTDTDDEKWPPDVVADTRDRAEEVKNALVCLKGLLVDKTWLPWPCKLDTIAEEIQNGTIDTETKREVENLVMKWSHQISEVLKRDSGELFDSGRTPTPAEEIKFWETRREDLECVNNRLTGTEAESMSKILDNANSRYLPYFKSLVFNVKCTLQECKSIVKHFQPLRRHLDNLTSASFDGELRELLRPLMHSVCLLWAYSTHYRQSVRIILLLRQICNLLIDLARNFLNGSLIFQLEPEEGCTKLRCVSEILEMFKELYHAHRLSIWTYFETDKPVHQWDFYPHLVFTRFDTFRSRVDELMLVFQTAVEFSKLEKTEIGGSRGKALSAAIVEIHEEFSEQMQKFSTISYDCCDPECPDFQVDYNAFTEKSTTLDFRISCTFAHAMTDCHTPESAYKLILIFTPLLDRPLIRETLQTELPIYVQLIQNQITETMEIFEDQILRDPESVAYSYASRHLPAFSSIIHRVKYLKDQLDTSISQFKSLEFSDRDLPPQLSYHLLENYQNAFEVLTEFQDDVYEQWNERTNAEGHSYLDGTVLARSSRHEIAVNLPDSSMSTFKEVKYLKAAGFDDIPPIAIDIFNQRKFIRKNFIHLSHVSSSYKAIFGEDGLRNVERNLLQDLIDSFEELIENGVTIVKWNDPNLWDFTQNLICPIQQCQDSLSKSRSNWNRVNQLIDSCNKGPLYMRKDANRYELLEFEPDAQDFQEIYAHTRMISDEIKSLCSDSKSLFPTNVNEYDKKWQEYLMEMDQEIIFGLCKVASSSLGYFMDHTDEKLTTAIFIEVCVVFQNGISFQPGLTDKDGLRQKIQTIFDNIFHQASLIDRVDPHIVGNYENVVRENPDLADICQEILQRIKEVSLAALEYTKGLEKYDFVWNREREKYLNEILTQGRGECTLEGNQNGDSPPDLQQHPPPSIDAFKDEMYKYKNLLVEIERLPIEQVFLNWLRLDIYPFIKSLYIEVEKWGHMFKQYLIEHVVGSLCELEEFIQRTEVKLGQGPIEGDLDALIEIMGILQRIKSRSNATKYMFDPLKDIIQLLRGFDYEPPETVFIQLDELPVRWQALLKMATNMKALVAPLQQNEVTSIKRRILAFDFKQFVLKDAFQRMEFHDVNCPFPHESIDIANKLVRVHELEYNSILTAAKLFEVNTQEQKILLKCRRQIRFSKLLWDYIVIVDAITDDWKMTPWRALDTENMDLECKRMAKDVKAMDKEVKSWDLFLHLESTVRHIASSLKSVGELQNPNIKERHWEELLKGTKILKHLVPFLVNKFSRDTTTPLADLYSLGLHNYEEEVKNIVDKAVKESSIEKTLKELESTWAVQEYRFEVHLKTGLKLVKVPEEVVEILEENQVQLQTIAMSKYIAFFKDEVKYWQNLLGHADKVLTTVLEVQRTWCHLESIFKSSEDIRINLPEDSARFDKMDEDFKVALSWLEITTNIIEGTTQERIYPEISRLQVELACCEKAVSDYLETKRLKFPRFYFVSSADLLDILSTNNEPLKVMRHLPKLFDSLSSLLFTPESEASNARKVAHSMKAKDGELVTLDGPCICFGQVENWLCALESSMRDSIRHYMQQCVNAYGEKPREDWIRDFPAQVALCGTQIWWTIEVNAAFSTIEDGGNENALKDYNRKQVSQLNTLISLLVGELSGEDRQKIMTICTIDVHSRDVVGKLIQTRVERASAFQWQSQLRHRWDQVDDDCFANICDAQLRYLHEYLGNTPRLVITPLTDRCYITLTQSVHLVMGGAPAGPAGTGKTETTKDLGRALGIMVYVFNCSEQMDYYSIGSIFKGLSMTGAWGCFDEFNRISVEVLSVVAVQVKSIQDAIRERKVRYNFMGEEIGLVPSVGIFITMNPGYAGRSELPENLKVLFRPCAMVVPDFELICEIMLVAEGFQEARVLARKFITLYTLCKELLSKQDHYDWGLRAIKSVLVVAGSLKRADSGCPESEVLMRALRDFNIPKIISDDIPVFMGLIGDLFPALDVPRRRDIQFENIVKEATKEMLLQPEDNFLLKVVQLQELMNVRHSVFIVGNAGTGKTQVWKTLFTSYKSMGMKAVYSDLNPKAVTSDELFGIINPATREWKDGIFSVLMRDQANMTCEGPKWIVLDGDIDPMWIESLNTVMDDNKVLTLASNERIPLTKTMRLLFEIHTLKHATPATVSRAGILYLNPQDLNWNVYVLSWLSKRDDPQEVKTLLMQLFNKYVPSVLESMKTRFKKVISIAEVSEFVTIAASSARLCLYNATRIPLNLHELSRSLLVPIYLSFTKFLNTPVFKFLPLQILQL